MVVVAALMVMVVMVVMVVMMMWMMFDCRLQVYKGVWRGTDVAVKRLLQQDIGKDSGMLDAFCQEVMMSMCDV